MFRASVVTNRNLNYNAYATTAKKVLSYRDESSVKKKLKSRAFVMVYKWGLVFSFALFFFSHSANFFFVFVCELNMWLV